MTDSLIIGGGISGLATALALAQRGHYVRLIEKKPDIHALGSGITLIGPALRALARLGVLDECVEHGFGSSEVDIRDPEGGPLTSVPLPPTVPGAPGLLGITRPDLYRILLDRATEAGVRVESGLWPTAIEQVDDDVRVALTDGTSDTFGLVVGADGIRSWVRNTVFGEFSTTFQNQVCIRAVLDRPASMDNELQIHGVPQTHVGFTPISDSKMYMYCCVPIADTTRPEPSSLPTTVREHLAPFGGDVAVIREQIDNETPIHYAPLETILTPAPWHSGRVVLVGDAAHATTPQLAAGGAMCLEDSLALAEELAKQSSVPDALASYTARRFERCAYVVETSVQLTQWQILPVTPDTEQQSLVREAVGVLAEEF